MIDQVLPYDDPSRVHQAQPQPRRGRLIFALDATASRGQTWDTACQLQGQMFKEVGALGSLSLQLVYFRGTAGYDGECKSSRWTEGALELARLISQVSCRAGETQIGRVLDHACCETSRQPVNALVFVGDACEEKPDQLIQRATALASVGVPAFAFQEGEDLVTQRIFQDIARITHGAYHRFDQGSASQLAELLRAVALFRVGGTAALENGSAAAKHLLGQIKPS
jgi:hypothetical protein